MMDRTFVFAALALAAGLALSPAGATYNGDPADSSAKAASHPSDASKSTVIDSTPTFRAITNDQGGAGEAGVGSTTEAGETSASPSPTPHKKHHMSSSKTSTTKSSHASRHNSRGSAGTKTGTTGGAGTATETR
jgi:hypothetical protein